MWVHGLSVGTTNSATLHLHAVTWTKHSVLVFCKLDHCAFSFGIDVIRCIMLIFWKGEHALTADMGVQNAMISNHQGQVQHF